MPVNKSLEKLFNTNFENLIKMRNMQLFKLLEFLHFLCKPVTFEHFAIKYVSTRRPFLRNGIKYVSTRMTLFK